MDYKETIDKFVREQRLKDSEWHLARCGYEAERKEFERRFNEEIRPNIRPASAVNYEIWLRTYINKGGKPTHYYDYNFPKDFYVAKRAFRLFPMYGAQSISVIIPEGIIVDVPDGLGHNNLYDMDEIINAGGWVPVYKDLI